MDLFIWLFIKKSRKKADSNSLVIALNDGDGGFESPELQTKTKKKYG